MYMHSIKTTVGPNFRGARGSACQTTHKHIKLGVGPLQLYQTVQLPGARPELNLSRSLLTIALKC